MASSGTETQWPGQGLGQGPHRRRRCWAWTQEQDADTSTEQDWGNEQSLPEATSSKLLEDFHHVQQHPPPLEWDPDTQESGESSREETEIDDVSSPEGSTLPLPWLPRHNQLLELSEEELDEAPRSPEVDATGERCPGLECEDQEDSNSVTLGQGPARSWVTSSKQGDGHGPSGHAKAYPSVELSPARSWSSGAVSLGYPSDSLNYTWEGDTDVPQSTALVDTLPQSPHHHFPHPDDRRGGEVALATSTEFQDSLAVPTQNPQCSVATWGRKTTSLPSSLPKDPTWKRTKTSPKPLPSRFTGSISPLSTRLGSIQEVRSPHKQRATLASHSSSESPKYGRGRLNYPLPDFSKVGPRVRFPKDESYRPPKSRGHNRQPQGPTRPLIFKSPAEIVREVLLSSGEASLAKDPPAHPISRVPQEFQTPEQATELVHQLQEDYHKLLTKYAEAENTIDQLRLGAKVHLYSDPPKPSQSVHSGLVSQGSKVLSFTIPQPQSAEWWPSPAQDAQTSGATGWPPPRADLSPSSSLSMPTPGRLPENQGTARDQPSAEQTQELTSQASRLLSKVECFEGLVLTGCLPLQDQIKGLGQLRAAHAALEEEYLQACREQHPTPQPDASKETPGTLHLCRGLEAEIYHLGQRLEELQDHMEQTQGKPKLCRPERPRDIAPATSFPHCPAHLPSEPTPSPATQTYPEPAITTTAGGPCKLPMNEERSPSSVKAEGSPRDQLAPLRDRELQMEQNFHGLLEQYLSVKSLPEALRMEDEEELEEEEKLEDEEDHHSTLEVDGPTAALGKAKASRVPSGQHLTQAEESHRAAVARRSEFKRQKRISEQLLPSAAVSVVPALTAPSVSHEPAENTPNLLLTRTERDQAIQDLQAEVSRLRLRLEDSLHRPPPGSPTRLASAFNHPIRTQDQPADSSPAWVSHCSSKSVERLSGESEGAEPAGPIGRRRVRSSSVPREVPQLSLVSESESPSHWLSSEKNRTSEDLRAVNEGVGSGSSSRRRDRVSFRGQYTGREYRVLSPKAVLKDSGTASCPQCQPTKTQDTGSTGTRDPGDPLGSSATDALCCALCGQVRPTAEGDSPISAPSESTPRRTTSSNPSPKQKSKRVGSPAQLPPGLWYLTATPPILAPSALAYISSAPIMPYPPATVYYATPGPTSAPTASPRPARRPRGTRHSVQLGLNDLEELQLALSQAAEAAESVRSTTRQLSRSLSADLRHARGLRGSCLF
uniref:AT-hook transcription factor n=1 Tax=Nannospalax galili TaxID=1026970 RepID=A0A8C6W7I6_NANGA